MCKDEKRSVQSLCAVTRYSIVNSGSIAKEAMRVTSTVTAAPCVLFHETVRRVTPRAMSSSRAESSTSPPKSEKVSPSTERKIVCVSAMLSIVCFSSHRPHSFSACGMSAKS